MKKIEVCLCCGQSVSKSLAYHAEVEKMIKNPVTGEIKVETFKGSICPECCFRLGYKVSKKKLEKVRKHFEKSE